VKACSPLSRTFPFLCTIRTVARSSPINLSWFLLIHGWWVSVLLGMWTQVPPWLSNDLVESCSSSFISDTAVVLIVKERTSLVLA
jgi:hypothetical protein